MNAPSDEAGGRIFFSAAKRTLEVEDEIRLTSVGVDIGSSTSHLVVSRLVLERLDSRYVVASREAIYESDILLTPYAGVDTIDAAALGAFIAGAYRKAGITPADIDTGALILTGVAVGRKNARAIAELFAAEAGKLVAVSAGDSLETIMAAYGAGAVAASIRERATVMNVDIGGGTSKLAICREGRVIDRTALDVGARLICLDGEGRVARIEAAGARFAAAAGIEIAVGATLPDGAAEAIADRMADALFQAMAGRAPEAAGVPLLRLDALKWRRGIDAVAFSGGVSEYIYGREPASFGDLGPALAEAVARRAEDWGARVLVPRAGIRATVIGASQYTIQVSGSTIFVAPMEALPLRNVPVIAPALALEADELDREAIANEVAATLARQDLAGGERPVCVFVPWQGSATFHRLDALCRGIADGLAPVLAAGQPLVLAGDFDIGGLIGIHCREELGLANPIVSVDGLDLAAFDFIDIGTMLEASGAVAVVIKSLVFPNG